MSYDHCIKAFIKAQDKIKNINKLYTSTTIQPSANKSSNPNQPFTRVLYIQYTYSYIDMHVFVHTYTFIHSFSLSSCFYSDIGIGNFYKVTTLTLYVLDTIWSIWTHYFYYYYHYYVNPYKSELLLFYLSMRLQHVTRSKNAHYCRRWRA